jgi:hypothetical protein
LLRQTFKKTAMFPASCPPPSLAHASLYRYHSESDSDSEQEGEEGRDELTSLLPPSGLGSSSTLRRRKPSVLAPPPRLPSRSALLSPKASRYAVISASKASLDGGSDRGVGGGAAVGSTSGGGRPGVAGAGASVSGPSGVSAPAAPLTVVTEPWMADAALRSRVAIYVTKFRLCT